MLAPEALTGVAECSHTKKVQAAGLEAAHDELVRVRREGRRSLAPFAGTRPVLYDVARAARHARGNRPHHLTLCPWFGPV